MISNLKPYPGRLIMCKPNLLVLLVVICLGMPHGAYAQAPKEIAGFILGSKIEHCEADLQMKTVLPIRYQPYLREVQIKSMGGFKTGLITFDDCADPGRILRIKMKYADSSKAFYQKLLKRFKARFGNDPEWRGDPFHITKAWKWSFRDEQGNRISLTLQHNLKDTQEKRGNSVKLSLFNGIEEARACFESAQAKEEPEPTPASKVDWDRLIPR